VTRVGFVVLVVVVVDDDDASSVDLLFHRFAGFLGHVSLDALAPS
jgi:hypothetical protein